MIAASKIGLQIVDIDPAISSVDDLRQALSLAKCKAIIFDPVTESQNNLLMLRKAIPEFYECMCIFRLVKISGVYCAWFLLFSLQSTTLTDSSSIPSIFQH